MPGLASRLKRRAYDLVTRLLRFYYRSFWGMSIGEGVRIARTAKLDTTNPRGLHIGDYTAVAFDAAILTHDFINLEHRDTRIGAYCLIGARSIILPGITIGDNCIVGAGSVVIADVPSNTLVSGNPARAVERDISTGKWGIRASRFLIRPDSGATREAVTKIASASTAEVASSVSGRSSREVGLDRLLDLDSRVRAEPLEACGLDSFGLVTLRAEIETRYDISIDDDRWVEIRTPGDIIALLPAQAAAAPYVAAVSPRAPTPPLAVAKAVAAVPRQLTPYRTRRYDVGMPQMLAAGLSEAWLLKELGDLHWEILTQSLGVASRDIADAKGERLYATFTCIRLRLGQSLNDIVENDELSFDMTMSRFGSGMFFSTTTIATGRASGSVDIMSNFSKFEKPGENTSLVRGQPAIPEDFAVPLLSEAPGIIGEYRNARTTGAPLQAIYESRYDIQPYHDINGVGLLYFAAYPIINDICLRGHFGPGDWADYTTIEYYLQSLKK